MAVSPCRIVALLLALSCSLIHTASSFTPLVVLTPKQLHARRFFATNNPNETDVERLLRRARELKAQAETDTRALHESRLSHNKRKHEQLDKCIDKLFAVGDNDTTALALRLKQLQYSTDELLDIITRLHEREIKAKGLQRLL